MSFGNEFFHAHTLTDVVYTNTADDKTVRYTFIMALFPVLWTSVSLTGIEIIDESVAFDDKTGDYFEVLKVGKNEEFIPVFVWMLQMSLTDNEEKQFR